jgi:hypothetical protein
MESKELPFQQKELKLSPATVGRSENSSRKTERQQMDALQLFGLFAVTAMLVCYALEDRDHLFILAFAVACALGSIYGFLQGAWPFGLVEAVWAIVALRRWSLRQRRIA